ncbi:MAG: SpoIIE family protein phosphatase [bacterium]|nr:SpoIIE family protein phosphatase [bacterium]
MWILIRHIKKNVTLRRVWIILFLCCIIPAACGNKPEKVPPRALHGILDLRGWDFEQDGPLRLSGKWEFYWQRFLAPHGSSPLPEKSEYILVPGIWNGSGTDLPGTGYATYRLTIHLRDYAIPLAFKFLRIYTAGTLYVNGKKITAIGTVGKNPQEARPQYRPHVIPYTPQEKTLEVLIHVSNFHHRKGGIRDFIYLGTAAQITTIRERNLGIDIFLFGSIIIFGFYHLLLLLLLPKKRTILFFGLTCVIFALFSLTRGEIYINTLIGPDWQAMMQLKYCSTYLALTFFSMFVHSLFPEEYSRLFLRFIQTACLSLTAITLATSVKLYSHLLPVFEGIGVMSFIYILFVCGWALYRKREGASIMLSGFIIMFLVLINDILYDNQVIQTGFLTPFGVISITLFQAILLSSSLKRAFITRNELIALEKEMDFAEMVQKRILTPSKHNYEHGGLEIAIRYMPMNKKVGGDYYNISSLPGGRVSIMIADAFGHGMQAALSTMQIDVLNRQILFQPDPAERLKSVNSLFVKDIDSRNLFTAFYLDINEGEITFASAGHPAQYLLKEKTGELLPLQSKGRIMGFSEESQFRSKRMTVETGDRVFLFTDGIFEEFNNNKEEFGEERLRQLLRDESFRNGERSMEDIVSAIIQHVEKFLNGAGFTDDITLVGIRLP